MTDEAGLEPKRRSIGGAVVVVAMVVLGAWAAVLLARSKRPPPPLPPYELPEATANERLPEKPTSGLAARQVLVFNNGVEPETLDPATMKGVPEHTIALALFEGLTTLHPRTLVPMPGIARSGKVSKDGRTYTFALRQSQWSNGEPLTAHDFVYSWRRALAPETASEYAYMLHPILNAKAFNEGEKSDPDVLGAEALDAQGQPGAARAVFP